jgi:hypothetical protein
MTESTPTEPTPPESTPAGWTNDELTRIGGADELQVSSRREDGSLRPGVTIWAVRLGDEVFIRSAYGAKNPWFRRAVASGRGHIRAGGVERDVTFVIPPAETAPSIDAEYHSKYDRYGPAIVGSVTGPRGAETTLRVVPE